MSVLILISAISWLIKQTSPWFYAYLELADSAYFNVASLCMHTEAYGIVI